MLKLNVILIPVLLFLSLNLSAQKGIIINENAILKSDENTFIKIGNDYGFVNNSEQTAVAGTLIFSGNQNQNISGTYTLTVNDFKIDNLATVILLSDLSINNNLTIEQSYLDVGSFDLYLTDSTEIDGSFSDIAMIVCTGDGKLIKEISENGSYFFPVGDLTDVPEYSPVTFNFNTGTYSNSTVSLNLKNENHPNNPDNEHYLNRYWKPESEGITDFDCNVEFQFVENDIVGENTEITTAIYLNSDWIELELPSNNILSGNLTQFGDITGVNQDVFVSVKDITQSINLSITDENLIVEYAGNNYPAQVVIVNSLGQVVYVRNLTDKIIRIPNVFASGIYILNIQNEGILFSQKFVIQK